MASREFTDATGAVWTVWAVTPQEMSVALRKLTGSSERRAPWLAFQNGDGDKRRLVPIPSEWETCDDAALVAMWDSATTVPPAPARRAWDTKSGPDTDR